MTIEIRERLRGSRLRSDCRSTALRRKSAASCSFDQSDPIQQQIAWRWDNLRPLPAAVNLGKGTKAPDL